MPYLYLALLFAVSEIYASDVLPAPEIDMSLSKPYPDEHADIDEPKLREQTKHKFLVDYDIHSGYRLHGGANYLNPSIIPRFASDNLEEYFARGIRYFLKEGRSVICDCVGISYYDGYGREYFQVLEAQLLVEQKPNDRNFQALPSPAP